MDRRSRGWQSLLRLLHLRRVGRVRTWTWAKSFVHVIGREHVCLYGVIGAKNTWLHLKPFFFLCTRAHPFAQSGALERLLTASQVSRGIDVTRDAHVVGLEMTRRGVSTRNTLLNSRPEYGGHPCKLWCCHQSKPASTEERRSTTSSRAVQRVGPAINRTFQPAESRSQPNNSRDRYMPVMRELRSTSGLNACCCAYRLSYARASHTKQSSRGLRGNGSVRCGCARSKTLDMQK